MSSVKPAGSETYSHTAGDADQPTPNVDTQGPNTSSHQHHVGVPDAKVEQLSSREASPEPALPVQIHDINAEQAAEIEKAHAVMPEEHQPTIGFIIPFPAYIGNGKDPEKDQLRRENVPPFLIYCAPPARLAKPADGQKEGMVNKATRHWQKEEDSARGKSGLKAKAIGLIGKGMSMTKTSGIDFLTRTPNKKKLKEIRLIYPADYPSSQLKEDFNKLITQTKAGARKSSIIATTLVPFALVFDTVTFIPGPFEVCCVWAGSSWIGTQRATAIANGVTSDKVPLNFAKTDSVRPLSYRLHELVSHEIARNTIAKPSWQGEGPPARGPQMASIVLDVLREQLNGDLSAYETDRSRIAEDMDNILQKAAKEWAKAAKAETKAPKNGRVANA